MTRNRAFLATIDATVDPEWAAVVGFYTAVHLVEQLRARLGYGDSQNHAQRNDHVSRYHASMYYEFICLYKLSQTARYDARADFFTESPGTVIVSTWLAAVETYVAAEIAALDANP